MFRQILHQRRREHRRRARDDRVRDVTRTADDEASALAVLQVLVNRRRARALQQGA